MNSVCLSVRLSVCRSTCPRNIPSVTGNLGVVLVAGAMPRTGNRHSRAARHSVVDRLTSDAQRRQVVAQELARMQRLNDLPLSCKLQHVRTTPISTRHERHTVVRHASRARTRTSRPGLQPVRAAELLTRYARAVASALAALAPPQ